jgi:amino acid permease
MNSLYSSGAALTPNLGCPSAVEAVIHRIIIFFHCSCELYPGLSLSGGVLYSSGQL